MHSPDSEYSVLSVQCNSSALTVCIFLFNVTNNTLLALLVSCLLILLLKAEHGCDVEDGAGVLAQRAGAL